MGGKARFADRGGEITFEMPRMRPETAKILMIVLIVLYFPIKFYILAQCHPPFSIRVGVAVIFWSAIFGLGIWTEKVKRQYRAT